MKALLSIIILPFKGDPNLSDCLRALVGQSLDKEALSEVGLFL